MCRSKCWFISEHKPTTATDIIAMICFLKPPTHKLQLEMFVTQLLQLGCKKKSKRKRKPNYNDEGRI